MSYQVEFEPEVLADLDRMDSTDRKCIFRKINWLALNFDRVLPIAHHGLSRRVELRSSFSFNSSSKLILGLIDFARRMRKVASARRLLVRRSKFIRGEGLNRRLVHQQILMTERSSIQHDDVSDFLHNRSPLLIVFRPM